MPSSGFGGLRVLSFESRRAKEIAQLITNQNGKAVVAPSTREVPEGPNEDALRFAHELLDTRFGAVIFLTGVGTRHLAQAIESVCSREQFTAALNHTKVIARGPKPMTVLREFGVQNAFAVAEPNTWHEILNLLDNNQSQIPLRGQYVAVQEYGIPTPELYAGLEQRGARVFPVHVYKWEPPENTGPLRDAIAALARGEIDVAMFTSSVQVFHLLQFAGEMKLREEVLRGLNSCVVASIGPTTSGTLRDNGIAVEFEPSHPKMGLLVKEVADRITELQQKKNP